MGLLGLKPKNKRKRRRKICYTTALLIIRNIEYTCTINNISRGGALLSIEVDFPIKIGQFLDIQIPFSDGKRYVRKAAKVKRFDNNSIAIQFVW